MFVVANCESCIHCIGGWDVEYGYDCKLQMLESTWKGDKYCPKYATEMDAFRGEF